MNTSFNFQDIDLVVGLGNLERQYKNTRHNVGFDFVEELAFTYSGSFSDNTRLKSVVAEVRINNAKKILVMPTTLMNRSGEAVQGICAYYKIISERVLVVHDDLDIALGRYKLQLDKGPREHNGIISVESQLGTSEFWRLRIGVDNRSEEQRKHMTGAEYVLGTFADEERAMRDSLIKTIIKEITTLTQINHEK